MADTYILIDKQGQAIRVPEAKVQQVAAEHLQRGEDFEIYRAERLRWEISLTPAQPTGGERPAARRAPAARRTRGAAAGTPRVGRPRENLGPCRVPGCDKPQKTRGLCSAHYQQHRRLARKDGQGLIDAEGNLVMRPEIASEGATRGGARTKRKAGKKTARKAGRRKATKKAAKKAGRKRGAKKKATKAAAGAETKSE